MTFYLFLYHCFANGLTHKECTLGICIHYSIIFLFINSPKIMLNHNSCGINKNINFVFFK